MKKILVVLTLGITLIPAVVNAGSGFHFFASSAAVVGSLSNVTTEGDVNVLNGVMYVGTTSKPSDEYYYNTWIQGGLGILSTQALNSPIPVFGVHNSDGEDTFQLRENGVMYVNTQLSTDFNAAQFVGNLDDYYQLNLQNLSSGTFASGDIVVTADKGDESHGYIDMGMQSSGYSDPNFSFAGPFDGYLFVQGPSTSTVVFSTSAHYPGDLAIGTKSSGTVVNFFVGGTEETDLKVTISTRGLVLSSNTAVQFKDNSIKVSNLYLSSSVYSTSGLYYTVTQNAPNACIAGSTLTFTTVTEGVYRVSYFGSVEHSSSNRVFMGYLLDGALVSPLTSTLAPMAFDGQANAAIPSSWASTFTVSPGMHNVCFVLWATTGSASIPQNIVGTFAINAMQ